jgi:hypothetical protein
MPSSIPTAHVYNGSMPVHPYPPPPGITAMQDEATLRWHTEEELTGGTHPLPHQLRQLLLDLHLANFDLWHMEDAARDPEATDHTIASIKRRIDARNQQRNDLMEQVDEHLLGAHPLNPSATLHTETPGQISDRLSILSLKIFHTREEVQRTSAGEQHRARNARRLELLLRQRDDLALALTALFAEFLAGTRRFQIYRQFKMYNDPELNPVIYRRADRPNP